MSALADEPPTQEKPATEGRTVAMTCEVCEHKWAEPASKAGKQTLCPECQRRQKIPELRQDQTEDWREKKTNLPSLAKRDEGPLEGVQASTQAKNVSVESMVGAGAIEEELDSLPMSYKFVMYGIPLLLVLALVGVGLSWWMNREPEKQKHQIAEAIIEFNANPPEMQPPAAANTVMRGILELAAGEHELRNIKTPEDLARAHGHLSQARSELSLDRLPPADRRRADRNALLGELALAMIRLGGTPEEVAAQIRFPWLPDTRTTRIVQVKEKGQHTVHEELQRVLNNLRTDSDFDFRIAIARRLVRDLVPRGQTEMARNIPSLLFTSIEQPEAKCVVALEILRLDPGALPIVSQFAQEVDLARRQPSPDKARQPSEAAPYSAQALFKAAQLPKAMSDLPIPPNGVIQEANLRANIVDRLFKNPGAGADAIALATRPANQVQDRARGLLQVAEWSSDPAAAVVEAAKLTTDLKKLSPADLRRVSSVVHRLSQIAAQNGKLDEAKALADVLPAGGYREWARGEIVRLRYAASKEPGDPAAMELPDDRAKWCPGHAWGRMAIARQFGRNGDDKKKIADWPGGVIHPFGLAGLSLGLQDNDLK